MKPSALLFPLSTLHSPLGHYSQPASLPPTFSPNPLYSLSARICSPCFDVQEPKREHRLIPILQFVHTQVYRYCFGRPADGLERSVEGEDECTSGPSLLTHLV